MPRIVDQAICLRHWDWSETSQTVSLLTREHGVVRGLAKGSKRERAPFSGGIEIATRGELVFIPKTSALSVIAAWDLQEIFPGVRASSGRFFAAMHLLDLAQHFVQEGDPHPPVFDALGAALRVLADDATGFRAILPMQWVCLDQAGLRPMLDRSADSGEPLAPAPTFGLSPALGGVVVDPGPSPGAGVYRVRAETIELLRALEASAPGNPALPPIPPAFGGAAVERACRLLSRYCEHVLGRAMHTAPGVFGGTA